jgi:very-short-patch-repair endonuclease
VPAGRFVARVDFAWPQHRLALEYDGAWHATPEPLPRDRRRINGLTAADWRVHFVTTSDLRRPDVLLADLTRALER